MANGNGQDLEATSALPGYTIFSIGGKPERIPPLTLWVLEAREKELNSINANMAPKEYADVVLLIAATSIEAMKCGDESDPTEENVEKTFKRLRRRIIYGEMRQLGNMMDQLLVNSGFPGPEELAPAKDGTGTSTESAPNSPSEESAQATLFESKENLH